MNWEQLRAILWLRWRLTRNQWSRGGQLNAVLSMIAAVICCAIGASGWLAGVLIGIFALSKATPMQMLGVWDAITVGFLFFWMIGIVSEIQRSETINIGWFLHLPISLRDIFLVNYAASHLSVTIILFLPGMVGLSLGLAIGRNWIMIWLLPLVLGYVFMITAWTYCLRGWLIRLMVNKRRGRAIIAGITLLIIVVSQLPNLFMNVMGVHKYNRYPAVEQIQGERQVNPEGGSNNRDVMDMILIAHEAVPLLWTANGAMSLAGGKVWPAVLGAGGTILIGGLGLRRAYRGTIRFYQGEATMKRVVIHQGKKEKDTSVKKNIFEGRLPGVSEEVSTLAMVFLRCLTRAPEVKMVLATNTIVLIIFGSMMLLRNSATVSDTFKPFIATGVVAFMFFGMIQLLFNQFGYDRNGFRTLVLLPVPRKNILLGKNLAVMPISIGMGLILLGIVKFAMGVSFIVVAASCLQLGAAFLLLSMAGNLSSVLAPYRIAPGSLKPTKVKATMSVMIILSHLLFPMLMLPLFIGPGFGVIFSILGWLPAGAVNFLFSGILLAVVGFCYKLSLKSLGELLQRREKAILQIVTQEIE